VIANRIEQPAKASVGAVSATVRLTDGGIRLDVMSDGEILMGDMTLGLDLDGRRLGGPGASIVHVAHRDVEDSFTAISGKAAGRHAYSHREVTVEVSDGDVDWSVIMRVAADGVAVRYRLPKLDGTGEVGAEHTSLAVEESDRLWVLDYQTWYETPRYGVDARELADGDYGMPVLLRRGERHVLLTESGIDGRFSGAHLAASGGTLRFSTADATVEVARGDATPWRVLIVGTLESIVGSRLVDELAPPSTATDPEWVRPGRAAWSWWSDFYSSAQLDAQQHFVDVAAKLGWEHLLIDCGWEETWVPEIVTYASRRGIQVHLWAIWRDLNGPEALRRLALWKSWGVAGIKVDFMESESKDRYRWYDAILAETERVGLMINFHGSVFPRGWARTYPHVIGYEAIRGAEYYVFFDNEVVSAAHNVIQPFTRNVVGAMDATPVAFSAKRRETSDGHELGLAIAFECGITHFADHVDDYARRPLAARALSELPAMWHETRLVGGTPDTEALVARRHDDRWFIGGIATGEARTIEVAFSRLGLDRVDAWVVTDDPVGSGAHGLVELRATEAEAIEIPIARNGGFFAIVAAEGAPLFRATPRPVQTSPYIDPPVAELSDGTARLTVDADATLRVPPGWSARMAARAGDHALWEITASRLDDGALGIVTVERAGVDGVPVMGHARVVAPIGAGTHALSDLPMLSFRNASGPVERDQSNGEGNPRDGSIIRIADEEFERGLGTAAPSAAEFRVGVVSAGLSAWVGIDDETPGASARVFVDADGATVWSAVVSAGMTPTALDVELVGVDVLTLRSETLDPASEGPFVGEAHVDWAAAELHVRPVRAGAVHKGAVTDDHPDIQQREGTK